MTDLNLRDLLDLCTAGYGDDWVTIPPGDHGTDLLFGASNVGTTDAPAVTTFRHAYRAVNVSHPSVGVGWGMDTRAPEDRFSGTRHELEWGPEVGSGTHVRTAHVLLNGAMVWRVQQAYLDWGSGIGVYLPNFSPRFDGTDESGRPHLAGWTTNRWEVEFARLCTDLIGTGETFPFDQALKTLDVRIVDIDAISASFASD